MRDAEVKEIEKSESEITGSPKSKIPNTFRALQTSQFSTLFCRTIYLSDGNVDAVGRAELARLSSDGFGCFIGFDRFCFADSGFSDRSVRRRGGGSLQPAENFAYHANFGDDYGFRTGDFDFDGKYRGLASVRSRRLFRSGKRFRYSDRQAFVTDMVGKEDLLNAIALNSSMFNGARIVGPAIAGILVAVVGEGWCFFANAVSYIAVITGILLMKITPIIRERKGTTLSNIAEGFSFVAKTPPIRGLLLLLGLISLMGMPYAVLMPIFADKILGGGSDTLGYLMGASGSGALIAALILASRKEVFGLGRWVAFASGGLGISLILFSFSGYFLAFAVAFNSRRIFDDDADVFVKHFDSGDGAGRIARARDERLFDDVYGNGSARRTARRNARRNSRRTLHRRTRRRGLHFRFAHFLSKTAESQRRRSPNDNRHANDCRSSRFQSEFSTADFNRRTRDFAEIIN